MLKKEFVDNIGDTFSIYITEDGIEIWSDEQRGTPGASGGTIYKFISIKNGRIVWENSCLKQDVQDVAQKFVDDNIIEVNKIIPKTNSYFCKFENIEMILENYNIPDAFSCFRGEVISERHKSGMDAFQAIKVDESKIIIKEI